DEPEDLPYEPRLSSRYASRLSSLAEVLAREARNDKGCVVGQLLEGPDIVMVGNAAKALLQYLLRSRIVITQQKGAVSGAVQAPLKPPDTCEETRYFVLHARCVRSPVPVSQRLTREKVEIVRLRRA